MAKKFAWIANRVGLGDSTNKPHGEKEGDRRPDRQREKERERVREREKERERERERERENKAAMSSRTLRAGTHNIDDYLSLPRRSAFFKMRRRLD
jgi:hypothetical protein